MIAKNQKTTEYAIIFVVVAIIVFVMYELLGQDIGALINNN